MGGGLMQLVAYGAQDVYLTGNPQITFWKVTYRRHTNFAVESIEQTFNGQADFGRRVTCTISRNGDLAYRTYLQVTLPEINQQMANANAQGDDQGVFARWLDFPGEQLVAQVEVEIGGQRIDRQYGDWMHIWNQLCLTAEQERGYKAMVGQTTQLTYITDPSFANVDGPCSSDAPRQVCAPRNALPETTLYVPFQFWYCRNPGLALPLIALQYHEVKINLDLRPIDECLWALSSLNCGGNYNGQKVTAAYAQSLVAASLYVDYVFLDTDERRRMAQNPHEYLIEQLQFTGDESVGSSSNKIKLNFNHPCKELVWVVQPDANVDYCSSLECGTPLFKLFGAQPFNYTDAVDAL
ncbi:MAG: major capsid protein, partial [Vampirovibrionia bacterium]